MNRIGRKKSSNLLRLEALVLRPALLLDERPDETSDGRRRRGSTGSIANLEAHAIATEPKRTHGGRGSVPPTRRRGKVADEKRAPRRSRIDKSYHHINERMERTSHSTSSLDKVAVADSPCLTADLTPPSHLEDETLDMYFDLIKQRSDRRRKLLHAHDSDLFASTTKCAQTVFAPCPSVVSGAITVRTEPAMRSSKSKPKKSSSKNDRRNENTSKLPRRMYAQISFEAGTAEVKYWKLRAVSSDDKTVRTGDEGPEGNIQPHESRTPSVKRCDSDFDDGSKISSRSRLQSFLKFKGISCSAA